ncbi:hypothetical protein GDO78_014748 [Eleutherodactylus coqui]|uniref:Uncharacterized protein n=1 Tax=Eleutherodactylus coqui TaxID=57060 RepID=A0A8J6B2X3_ELECQ|nr:hypothetical protein GDO78_014748 [Eleutherodactylus coqui]
METKSIFESFLHTTEKSLKVSPAVLCKRQMTTSALLHLNLQSWHTTHLTLLYINFRPPSAWQTVWTLLHLRHSPAGVAFLWVV